MSGVADDNFTVSIDTPRNVLTNVTLNYSVETAGAAGNVTAVWEIDGETKRGTTVQHEFETDGNATIEVTVTDESGASVTKSTTVSVVDLEDEEESQPLRTIGAIVIIFVSLVILPFLLKGVVLPWAMRILDDAL